MKLNQAADHLAQSGTEAAYFHGRDDPSIPMTIGPQPVTIFTSPNATDTPPSAVTPSTSSHSEAAHTLVSIPESNGGSMKQSLSQASSSSTPSKATDSAPASAPAPCNAAAAPTYATSDITCADGRDVVDYITKLSINNSKPYPLILPDPVSQKNPSTPSQKSLETMVDDLCRTPNTESVALASGASINSATYSLRKKKIMHEFVKALEKFEKYKEYP